MVPFMFALGAGMMYLSHLLAGVIMHGFGDALLVVFGAFVSISSGLGMSFSEGIEYGFLMRSYFQRAARFVVAHQIIGFGEKIIDALFIFLLITQPVYIAFLVVTPIYYVYTLGIIRAYDFFLSRGLDLLELETLKEHGASEHAHTFLRWVFQRRVAIFVIGSCCVIDPDGVTILLRKDKNFWRNAIIITLPSVVICMIWWTTVMKLGIMGVSFFAWFL